MWTKLIYSASKWESKVIVSILDLIVGPPWYFHSCFSFCFLYLWNIWPTCQETWSYAATHPSISCLKPFNSAWQVPAPILVAQLSVTFTWEMNEFILRSVLISGQFDYPDIYHTVVWTGFCKTTWWMHSRLAEFLECHVIAWLYRRVTRLGAPLVLLVFSWTSCYQLRLCGE